MSELCKWCAYEHSDCKGNKDIPYNMHCQYYKKPAVFNAKEAAQQIQFLRGVLDQTKEDYFKLKIAYDKLEAKYLALLAKDYLDGDGGVE